MSVGPFSGVIGSASGAPVSQTSGSETERAGSDSRAQQRKADADTRADNAAGIGQTSEDQESSERDADGRRPWELRRGGTQTEDDPQNDQHQVKDPTGERGGSLDLTG